MFFVIVVTMVLGTAQYKRQDDEEPDYQGQLPIAQIFFFLANLAK